ncbi:MAG: hypothetical protein JXB62_13295 [Pirellulales bacterium]|nr:hypothetical protein [Pirellulales bacterium]
MHSRDANSEHALGFLTVMEHAQHGLFGGYLLLNVAGRPLEFHCTTPIKANRAQEILYGPTLQSFLYGEQIGQTLLDKAKTAPCFVCTDQQPALAVRQYVSAPVALVLGEEEPPDDEAGQVWRVDAAHRGLAGPSGPGLLAFQLGRNRLAVPCDAEDDRQLVAERIARLPESFAESFDLCEPFLRIREAIEEAQKAVR